MITKCRYGDFSIPGWNDLIADSLRLYGEWAQIEIDTLANFIAEGDVVVDAGAFIGTHARAFSALAGRGGEVLAFEPNGLVYPFLEDNASRSQYMNIRANPCALGSVEERGFLIRGPDIGNEGHARVIRSACDGGCQAVLTKPLDAFGITKVNFIKADVEGMELSVIDGARNLIHASRPIIFLEVNDLERSSGVLEWAKTTNYCVYGTSSLAFNRNNFNGVSDNIFGQAKECGLLLINEDSCTKYSEKINRLTLPKVETIDDLALLLLHKPQYAYEILDKSVAATTLSINYPAPTLDALAARLAGVEQAKEEAHRLAQERQATLDALAARLAGVEQAKEEAQRLAQERQATLDALAARLAAAEQAKDEAQGLAQERQATLDALAARLAAAEQAKDEAQGLAQERQATLDALYVSTSWRMTAPLRSLKRLIVRS
jgi:FkbM family methyltransferase